jgi:hypothetical protein
MVEPQRCRSLPAGGKAQGCAFPGGEAMKSKWGKVQVGPEGVLRHTRGKPGEQSPEAGNPGCQPVKSKHGAKALHLC